ncbi:hypothetical protein YC2023_063981 [Brassica napus]
MQVLEISDWLSYMIEGMKLRPLELVRTGRPTTGTDVYAFGVFMLEVSCGRRMFEPRAESEQAVLPDWVVNRWERGDIEEAVCERIRQDHDKGELELLLKLGVLCSHQAEEVRSHMSTVVKILEGVSELHDNVLDRTEKKEKWYEKYSEVLDSVTMMESVSNFNVTEPIASLERTKATPGLRPGFFHKNGNHTANMLHLRGTMAQLFGCLEMLDLNYSKVLCSPLEAEAQKSFLKRNDPNAARRRDDYIK